MPRRTGLPQHGSAVGYQDVSVLACIAACMPGEMLGVPTKTGEHDRRHFRQQRKGGLGRMVPFCGQRRLLSPVY